MADDTLSSILSLTPTATPSPGMFQSVQQPPAPAPAYPSGADLSGIDLSTGKPYPKSTEGPVKATFSQKLLGLLNNFRTGMGEAMMNEAGVATPLDRQMKQAQIADAMSQVRLRNAQADSMQPTPWLHPETGKPILDDNGQPMMVPKWFQQTQLANYGKVAAASVKEQGANYRHDTASGSAMTPERQAGQAYMDAAQAGNQAGMDSALKQLNDLRAKSASSISGKIDPIILAQIGPPPDPTKDPQAAKVWGLAAEVIKTRMGPGPRVTSVLEGGVPTTVRTADAAGKPTANLDPGVAARKAGAVAFGSGTESDQIQSFRAFAGHADDLSEAVKDFSTTSAPLANRPINWLRSNAAGDPAVANLLAKIDPVRKEFESFLLNNRALYSQDREEGMKIINENQSPAAMQAAIRSFMHTASIRLGSLNQKYKDLYGTDHPTMIDPTTGAILNKYGTPTGISQRNKTIEQFSPSRNQYRYSLDGGRTWQTGRAPK